MIGNGESISCTHKGKLDVVCKHKDGSTAKHTWEVKIVPQLNHDLFSVTKAMKEGWQMNSRWKEGGLMIELSQPSKTSMKFDRMIPSGSSWLMGIKTQRLVGQAHAVIEPGKSMPIWKFHQITGHTGEHLLRPTAEYMGVKLTGQLEPCEMCAQANITQANVPKKKEKQVPSRPGYRMFIDISSFKHESMGGKRHWLILVDELSDCSHSFFLKRKSDQIELFPNWIKELKAKYGIDIKYIRLDNSGENKGLQDECEKQNLGIIFEFTAPGTPQQNSVVERKIPTLMGRSRAMMLTAGFSQQDKRKLWCEVISTATKLDNIMVTKDRTKPPFTLFYNDEAKYTKFLRSFGEMAVIAISDGKKMRSKLDTRGRTGIFVGYADNHAGNVYRFINIETKKIIKSLEQKFGEKAMKARLSLTPGTPRFIARTLENKEDKVNAQDHETYRNGVGTLLYLTKHSRPDISNPVRELSKTMDSPAQAHLKEMYKLIKFVLSTKDYDKETRISIFGYVIYFCGIPIAWSSKGMKSVVLSTTEAEYMALSEVVKELKFIVQLLQTMNITVELPITVHVDNVGAIWLSNNRNTGDRTKHIDLRTAFVKEYQEDGKIIIKFEKSEDNEADIFTKNTSSIIYQNHQEKLVWDKNEVTEDEQ